MGVRGLENISLGRKEDWAAFVTAEPRTAPERVSACELAALTPATKAAYDRRRRDWHANMGVLLTQQLTAIHDTLWDVLDSNVHDGDRIKGAVALEGAAGLGKSTVVEQFAKEFHLREVAEHGPRTSEGNERWPVCRVTLSGHPTMRDLNLSLLHFFAHPGIRRGSAALLARRALDTFLACEVRLLIVDDIHFLRWRASDGVAVSNHLKFIANEFPITLLMVGVNLENSGLFTEGHSVSGAVLAQTARRTTRLTLDRFDAADPVGERHWKAVLRAIDDRLILACHRRGSLPALADYLFARSSGHMGSLMTLINRAASRAIRTGAEALTEAVLDATRIDEAAEKSRDHEAARLRTTRTRRAADRRRTTIRPDTSPATA